MLQFTLKQLQYFIAVAETGSLTEASHQVHIAQPAIASAIKKLESELDVELVVRHHAQGISLTAAGERILVEAKSLLQHAIDFQDKGTSISENLAGEIHLGCAKLIAPVVLPTLLNGFSSKYQKIKISVSEGTQREIVQALHSGEIELGLVTDLSMPEDIEISEIYESPFLAILPEGHQLASRDSVSLTDLAQEPFILFDIPMARQYMLELFEEHSLSPNILCSASSMEVLRGMVGLGMGVSIVSSHYQHASTYDGHRIESRPVSEVIKPLKINVGHLRNLRISRNAEEFITYCTSEEVRACFT